jgi:hypothetical protein
VLRARQPRTLPQLAEDGALFSRLALEASWVHLGILDPPASRKQAMRQL